MIEDVKETPFLTTIDNIWNPFTNFDQWFAFDLQNQHYSNQVLAKIALVSEELSDEENRQEIERAIDRILELDPIKEFAKVYPSTYDADINKARHSYIQWYNNLNDDSKQFVDEEFVDTIKSYTNK
jgi:hypothetical protein